MSDSAPKWAELSGKTVALFGLGDQVKYKARFASGLAKLHAFLVERGAKIVGQTSTEGYEYEDSPAVHNERFVGLVLDNDNQGLLTEQRLDAWCAAIKDPLLQATR